MPTIANRRTRFRLTNMHLTLLKHAFIGWNQSEFGAPEINPKRPYGNSDVCDDIRQILDIREEMSDLEIAAIHKGTKEALEIVLQTQKFEPGVYELQHVENSLSMYVWQKIADDLLSVEDSNYSAANGKVYILRANPDDADITDVYTSEEKRIGAVLQTGSVFEARNLQASTIAYRCLESEIALDALIAWYDRHHGK